MSAISQTINNVLGGVSQQPDPVKLPGQVREAVNVYLDPTFGCVKRPGTQFISKLSGDIPEDSAWFPIFRDDKDRYVACIYKDNTGTNVRVWAADTGEERTVTLKGSSLNYLTYNKTKSIKALTINDYTFLVNSEKTVTMSTDDRSATKEEALVVVNQVAYNTNYVIDFLKDGETNTEKVWQASKLSIDPGSFEVEDEGECTFAGTESFAEDGEGDKAGLGFTITARCNPTLETDEIPGIIYPTSVDYNFPFVGPYQNLQEYFVPLLGPADAWQAGSYRYAQVTTSDGKLTLRWEVQVNNLITGRPGKRYDPVKAEILTYDENFSGWRVGYQATHSSGGTTCTFRVGTTKQGQPTPEYDYISKYLVDVELRNGGQNWRIGDQVTVTMEGKEYTVTVTDEAFTYSYASDATVSYTSLADTEEGALNVGVIVANLVSQINELDNYDAVPIGNVIYIERTDGRAFNISVRGGAADKALYGLKDSVNDVSLLPPQGLDGVVLRVSNSASSDADDYYVKFTTEGGIPGLGYWDETVAKGIPTNLNNSTMPHVLIREDDGNFTLQPLSKEFDDKNFWVGRTVGDEKTNPVPTFVDKQIKDVFFFMNRLGILSQDTVIMSQAGDYFNFFQGSAIAISDGDPIDMAASSTKPASLKAAIGTPAGLLLFAENSQFLLATEDVAFGPATVKMTEITNYSYNSDVEPVETGVSVLFATSAETYTKVFELSTDSLQARALVSENTRIIPEYIPPDLTLLTSVPNSSLVLMGTGDRDLYVFKFYNSGNERNLAGWTTWTMATDIKSVSFAHDTGYFIGYNSSGEFILSRMELIDDPEKSPISAFGQTFTPRLDHYIYQENLTTEPSSQGRTRINLPDGFQQEGAIPYLVATFSGTETFYAEGVIEQDPDDQSYYFDVVNDIEDSDFIVGLGYEMSVLLPSFFVKSGDQNQADRRNPPMVENLYLELYYSGRYTAVVSKTGYLDRTVELDTPRADVYLANSAAIEYFSTRAVPLYSRGDLVTVTIKAPDPLPASFTSYSWEGHYSTRGIATR